MIIDAHNHPDWLGHDFDKFIKNMDEYGIDKTCILSWEAPISDYEPYYAYVMGGAIKTSKTDSDLVPFAMCLDYKQKAPDRFILGYAPDPRRRDALYVLKSALDIYGVQICGEVKVRMLYDNPDCIDYFRFCGDAGLPVTLHFDAPKACLSGYDYPRKSWWYGGTIDNLERLLKACPNTNFLGHAPGFWSFISNDEYCYTCAALKGKPLIPGGRIEELLDKFPNLHCDISAGSGHDALTRDLDYTYKLINKHPDRFVYARDCFDNKHQNLIESLNLSKDVKELIYHGNIERLLKKY